MVPEKGDLIIVKNHAPNMDDTYYKLVCASSRISDLFWHPAVDPDHIHEALVLNNCILLEGKKNGLYVKITEPVLLPQGYRWTDDFYWMEGFIFVKFLVRDQHAVGYNMTDEGIEPDFSDSDD